MFARFAHFLNIAYCIVERFAILLFYQSETGRERKKERASPAKAGEIVPYSL
jgi:hypothetical protein